MSRGILGSGTGVTRVPSDIPPRPGRSEMVGVRQAATEGRRAPAATSTTTEVASTMTIAEELMTIERVAVLQRVAFFADVPGHTLVAVARLLEEASFDTGTTIIERGAVEDWLFVVAEGQVQAHIGDRTVATIGPGGVVGEFAVLAPAPRSATVTAVEPSLLLRLRRVPFEELLDDRPEIARGVISTLARLLQAVMDSDAEAPEASRG